MDAVNSLILAKSLRNEIQQSGFIDKTADEAGGSDELFYEFVQDADLRTKTEKLFKDGHYARAVEEAYKFVDNLVKKRVGDLCDASSGVGLMRTTFSPNSPILALNDGLTAADSDEQRGYMDILAGCMMGIRNPRAHDAELEDGQRDALKLLSWADHLVSRVKNAKMVDRGH